jgi:hypothetical protein
MASYHVPKVIQMNPLFPSLHIASVSFDSCNFQLSWKRTSFSHVVLFASNRQMAGTSRFDIIVIGAGEQAHVLSNHY